MGSYHNNVHYDRNGLYEYHVDPDNPFNGVSLPTSHRRSVQTPLYSSGLLKLEQRTDANLKGLAQKLVQHDPCYEYGMQHWHPDHRQPKCRYIFSFYLERCSF